MKKPTRLEMGLHSPRGQRFMTPESKAAMQLDEAKHSRAPGAAVDVNLIALNPFESAKGQLLSRARRR